MYMYVRMYVYVLLQSYKWIITLRKLQFNTTRNNVQWTGNIFILNADGIIIVQSMIMMMMLVEKALEYRDQCVFYGAMAITVMLLAV